MPPLCLGMIFSSFGSAQREHAPSLLISALAQLPEGCQGNRQGSSGRECEGEAPRKKQARPSLPPAAQANLLVQEQLSPAA
jgi:hypothetical protein